MALKKQLYRVWLTGDDVDGDGRQVEVTHGDMLRGELEAKKHGLSANPGDNPMHAATLWVWASLVRTGDTSEKFRDFCNAQLLGFNEDKEAPDAESDPTRPTAPTSSVSSSPAPTPAQAIGSTPTSPTS